MILPQKHITLQESLLGLSSFVLLQLDQSDLTVDEIWLKYLKINNSKKFPAKHNFDDIILAIDILFSLKKIKSTSEGKLIHGTN